MAALVLEIMTVAGTCLFLLWSLGWDITY
jgi:hypothetical protein